MITRHATALGCLIACALLLPGCWPTDKPKTGLVVVNVLDQPLYNDCHITGSINVPFDEIDLIEGKVSKDAEVVVYCSNAMCTADAAARDRMRTIGFKNVRSYEPGIAGWYQAGLPVAGPCTESYLKSSREKHPESDDNTISTTELMKKLNVKPTRAPVGDQ